MIPPCRGFAFNSSGRRDSITWGVVVLLSLGGCFGPSVAVVPPEVASSSGSEPATQTLPGTIVREAAALPGAAGVVLIGQRRSQTRPGGSDAWIGVFDLDGRPRWELRFGEGFAWAVAVLVDPAGGIHVFGRDLDGAWLLSLDGEGRRRGLVTMPARERLGFALVGTQVQVFLAGLGHEELYQDNYGLPVLWLRMDWTRTELVAELVPLTVEFYANDYESLPYVEALGPDLLGVDGEIHRVETRDDEPGLWTVELRDATDAEQAYASAPTVPEGLPVVALEANVLASLDLGASALLLLQRPPSAGADASVLLRRATKPVPTEHHEGLVALAAAPGGLPTVDTANDGDAHSYPHWLWSWSLIDIARYADNVEFGAWLAEGSCEAIDIGPSECDTVHLGYREPSFFAPNDDCWRHRLLIDYLGVVGRAAFQANFSAFVDHFKASYFFGQHYGAGGYSHEYDLESTLGEAMAKRALNHGRLEALIRAMLFDFADDYASRDAIEWIGWLPPAQAEALAHALLADMRDDPNRCAEVSELVAVIESLGGTPPIWQADLKDSCDILYLVCTGMQPDLLEQVISPRGIEYVVTCGDERPTNQTEAEDRLLSVCEPRRWRSNEVESELWIDPLISATCGDNRDYLNARHSCGVDDDFDVYELSFGVGTDGNAVLERVDILRTSVD